MTQNTLRSSLPSIFKSTIAPTFMQRCLEIITAGKLFKKSSASSTSMETAVSRPIEKENARIIIYGHSWGATETVVFARELGKKGIPVLLTVQVDSIAKPGRDNSKIPANVAKAINFYQSGGPLHGRAEIFAADPAQTKIIGNLHMTYEGHTINCDNYPWFARTFNKPHHEIENDLRVWTLPSR